MMMFPKPILLLLDNKAQQKGYSSVWGMMFGYAVRHNEDALTFFSEESLALKKLRLTLKTTLYSKMKRTVSRISKSPHPTREVTEEATVDMAKNSSSVKSWYTKV